MHNLTAQHSFGAIDLSSPPGPYLFAPLAPIQILQIGIVADAAVSGDPSLFLGLTLVGGGAADPAGLNSFGSFTVPDLAVGAGAWIDLTETFGRAIVYPGEEIRMTQTVAGTGSGMLLMCYNNLGFNDADFRSSQVGHPGSNSAPRSLSNMTKVTS